MVCVLFRVLSAIHGCNQHSMQVAFLNLHTFRSLTDSTIPDAVLIHFDILMMSTVLLETCR